MKFNFNRKAELGCIFFIILLCGGLIKFIFERKEINYLNSNLYRTIKITTITEIINEITKT